MKDIECDLEFQLIDAEELYHISRRFPKRFDYLTGWERYVKASEWLITHDFLINNHEAYETLRRHAAEKFKIPLEWLER
jgi:hypothetical protein